MSHFAASVKHYKNFRRFICDFDPVNLSVHCVSKKLQSCCFWNNFEGVFIATRLNWTQLTQLNSEQPSQSCFCLWRHDLQTESTGSLRSLIGDSCSRRERVDNSTSSWVELCRYKRAFRCPSCFVHREKRDYREIYASGGGFLVAPINSPHLL